ncbi:MAG: hypothetical protein KY476_19685 [Planctomycetes bacterium]|nr:hypothetical protein [Planctomycetota bacterium]
MAGLQTAVAFQAEPPQRRWGTEYRVASPPRTEAPRAGTEQPGEPTCKLSFFNADWNQILSQVAEETGSTLVMFDTPPGRLTRRDRNHYTRAEAVRILNRELEPQGFRILEKDQYLTVIHRQRARTEYRPRVQAEESDPPPAAKRQAEQEPVGYKRDVFTLSSRSRAERREPPDSRGDGALSRADSGRGPFHEARPPLTPPWDGGDQSGGVRPASLFDEREQHAAAAAEAALPRGEDRHVTSAIQTQRSAADVARTIYKALSDRAELVDRGPEDLPAFRVYFAPEFLARYGQKPDASRSPLADNNHRERPAAAPVSAVHFEIGIDTRRNELVLAAGPSQVRSVADLVRRIDGLTVKPGESVKLVSAGPNSDRIAQQLQPTVRKMAAQRAREDARDRIAQRPDAVNQPPAQPQPRPQPPTPPSPPLPGGGEGGAPRRPIDDFPAEGVKGDVEIEVLPGGLLLLRGNLQDVEAVQDLIDRIQQLARGTTPDIELLYLNHVNSEAMAALLTEVYDTLNELRGRGTTQPRGVAFIPVVRPNAILILAPRIELDSILRLAEELDKPVDPGSEFQVFRLKNAVASQLATTISNAYPADRPGLAARVTVFADPRTNSLIVRARPADMAEFAMLVQRIDSDAPEAVSRVRVFELRNAVAEELAQTINNAIQSVLAPPQITGAAGQVTAAGQTAQEFRDVKSVALEFLSTDGDARRLIRSGVLSDIRVTPDIRTNSLVVTAPEASMEMMAELIRRLDQPTSTVAEIKVFTLENSDADVTAELLRELFEQEDQDQLGVQVATADDASSGLIPLRFSVDPRTNSVIAIGGAAALEVVEAIILRLDQTEIRERKTEVIKLRNTPATEIGAAINAFLQSQRDLLQIDPDLVTTTALLEREIIAVAEPVSNSILISATPQYYEEILEIIRQLDAAPPQVVIQALLVEVELTNTDEFGVELGFQDDVLFDRGVTLAEDLLTIAQTNTAPNGVQTTTQQIISQATTPGFAFNNQPLGRNITANPSQVGTQGLSNFSLGRTNAELGFGGLVLSASSSSISVLIRALAARRQVHVLSRPQITTLDNQPALIQVGQDVPITQTPQINTVTGQLQPIAVNANQFRSVGIILEVIPRITPEGTIVMEVIATKSNISADSIPIFTDPQTGNTITSPIYNVTTARSTVSIPNGQTIVMGGMITKEDDTLVRKVPWLGDVPWLGSAFRYDSTSTRRTELLIFLTPRIVRTDADAELIKQVEAERLHFVEEDAEMIHGPLYAVPLENGDPLSDPWCPPGMPFYPSPTPGAAPTPLPPLPKGGPGGFPAPGPTYPASPGLEIEPPLTNPVPQPNGRPAVPPAGTETGWRNRPTRGALSYEDGNVPTTVMPSSAAWQNVPANAMAAGPPPFTETTAGWVAPPPEKPASRSLLKRMFGPRTTNP